MEVTPSTASQSLEAVKPLEVARPPVFIVGPSRSGTTLLARMLDAHSALAIFPETWMYVVLDGLGCLDRFSSRWQYILFMNQVWGNLKDHGDAAAAVAAEAMRRPQYVGPTRPVLEGIGQAYASARRAKIWGEKTPGHVLWLPEIHSLFPEAKLLFCVRDPRDVLVSYCERWNHGRFDSGYVMEAASMVRHYLNHMLQRPGFPSDQILWVRYESLTKEPSEVMQQVCRFLGIDFEPDMLNFYRQQQDAQRARPDTSHHTLLSRPITTERVGRFRQLFSPSTLSIVEAFLKEEMEALGYAPEGDSACILAPQDRRAQAAGVRVYQDMISGKFRRRSRRGARIRLWLLRAMRTVLAATPFTNLAVTAEEWQRRTQAVSPGDAP